MRGAEDNHRNRQKNRKDTRQINKASNSASNINSSGDSNEKSEVKTEMNICEERLSPTRQTIDMFEGLAASYLVIENTQRETSNEVTIDEIREKIKEILSVPLSEDNETEMKEDEVERLHEENMKILKQKLRLNDSDPEGDRIEIQDQVNTMKITDLEMQKVQTPVASFANVVSTRMPNLEAEKIQASDVPSTTVIPVSVPKIKSKLAGFTTSNIEETRKIYTRKRGIPERKKSIVQFSVTDLTSEIVQISNTIPKTPLPSFVDHTKPIVDTDEIRGAYNKEKEMIEMAKRADDSNSGQKITVEYIENTVKKENDGILTRILRFVSCGMI